MSRTARLRIRLPLWPSSVKARIIAGFGLLVLILGGVTLGASLQVRAHQADLAELESHSTMASLLQKAEAQAGISALLLQRYVAAGNDAYVAEINDHATAAQEALTAAVAQGTLPEVAQVSTLGAPLVESAARAATLRQKGDIEGAEAALEEMVPIFRDYRLKLEELAAQELERVAELRATADHAGDVALWLLVLSGVIGTVLGLASSIFIARSIIAPLTSLEETAARVSEGDLSARAPARGPRELAHLGSAMNHMVAAVEERAAELRLANRKLREQNRQLLDARTQAATDPLTSLGNHRSFHKRIREDVSAAGANGTSIGLVIFDVDGFKAVNDSLGHLAGDELLRDLSAALTKVVKREDTYRYGGDEFAVLLAGADRAKAIEIADSIRRAVEQISAGKGTTLTVSLGVAAFPEAASSAEQLIYKADMAMYWAKSTGKNRVSDWDGLQGQKVEVTGTSYSERGGRTPNTIASLMTALSAKDPATSEHSERCSWYTAELARELGLSDEDVGTLRLAALLHDLGKLVTPDEILRKPGPLDKDETASMRQHPIHGMSMLTQIDDAAQAIPAILHHHEHFDGSGYPDGLAGDEIPIASRILLVTDAFDAMTTDRPYRKAMPEEAAIQELRRCSGSQFDPRIVEAFLRVISRIGAHPLRTSAATDKVAAGSLGGS